MSDAVHRELKAAHPRALAALIDDLRDSPAMRRYPYYHAARRALRRASAAEDARSGYREALRHTRHPAERAHLKSKLANL